MLKAGDIVSNNVLINLKLLRDDMKLKGWFIDSFFFEYKNKRYIVLVKRFTDKKPKKDKYALLELEFLEENNFKNSLIVEANSVNLLIDTQRLREYFGIQSNENYGELREQFKRYLANFIPNEVIENKSKPQLKAMVKSLSESDSEDPNKIYCHKIKRNPNKQDGSPGTRREYNENKARILRKSLYERLKDETNLSFCFYDNPIMERTDEEIISNWAKNRKSVLLP